MPAPGQRNHQRKEQPRQNADFEGCTFQEIDVQEVDAESDQSGCDGHGHTISARLRAVHDRPPFPGIILPCILRGGGKFHFCPPCPTIEVSGKVLWSEAEKNFVRLTDWLTVFSKFIDENALNIVQLLFDPVRYPLWISAAVEYCLDARNTILNAVVHCIRKPPGNQAMISVVDGMNAPRKSQ